MPEIHIHERLNAVLNILDRMTLQGYQQFNAVATAMKEIASLDQDILKAEQAAKEEEVAPCEACQTHYDGE